MCRCLFLYAVVCSLTFLGCSCSLVVRGVMVETVAPLLCAPIVLLPAFLIAVNCGDWRSRSPCQALEFRCASFIQDTPACERTQYAFTVYKICNVAEQEVYVLPSCHGVDERSRRAFAFVGSWYGRHHLCLEPSTQALMAPVDTPCCVHSHVAFCLCPWWAGRCCRSAYGVILRHRHVYVTLSRDLEPPLTTL